MPIIAFINKGFPVGGVARVTMDIARYCRAHAPEFKIVILGKRVGPIPEDLQDIIVGAYPGLNYNRYVQQSHAQLVVACSTPFTGVAKARKKGIKVIFANHGEAFHEKYAITSHRKRNKLLWNLFYKKKFADGTLALKMAKERAVRNYENCDKYVVLCEGYKQDTLAILPPENQPHHIVTINNSERPVAHPQLNKEKLIVFSGRLDSYDKAPDRLLRIWGQVQELLPDYRLEIVGDGPERANLEALAAQLGLKNLCFAGWQTDVSPWYRKADIVCLVSRTEGWGLSISEGMAHGCIPIAFNCSAGVAELLQPSGFAVPPGDEEAFARTLVKVARLPEEEKLALRKKGIEKAQSLDPDRICQQWINLFREVLSE